MAPVIDMSHHVIWPIPLVEMTIDKSMLTYRSDMEVFPYGIFVDLFKVYDRLLRMKKKADIIIPNHDAAYIGGESIPH